MMLLALAAVYLTEAVAGVAVSAEDFSKTTYDYVVVGGGTAGLVVANRLSEISSIRVGIIEAGEDLQDDENINSPQGGGYLANPTYDWCFLSTPQPEVDGRQIFYARGKMLGGSSGINSMIWQRPSREELDFWNTEFQNGPEWTFDTLSPYFKKAISWTPPTLLYPGERQSNGLAAAQGFSGPINISYNEFHTDVDSSIVASGNHLGIETNSNQHGGNPTGFSQIARTVDPDTQIRSYSANAYYGAYSDRPNMHLLTGAHTTKIVFSDISGSTVATGVEYLANGKKFTVNVEREVILAAGSVQTPQLLELSGVGNKTLLEGLGIPVVLDLPEIGENLQDHPVSLIDVEMNPGVITLDELRINSTYSAENKELYEKHKTGAYTQTASILSPAPLQKFVSPEKLSDMLEALDTSIASKELTPLQKIQYRVQREMINGGKLGWTEFTMVPRGGLASPAEEGKAYVTVVAIELHSFSQGSIHINSADPLKPPTINPQFLTFPFDAEVLAQGTKFLQKWMLTKPIGDMVAKLHSPPELLTEDEEALKYVRKILATTNHPLGTTAMAPRSIGGVVDPTLKVYGLENVRVVDASVIPLQLGVATLSLVYAVAEKASDIIKADYVASVARTQKDLFPDFVVQDSEAFIGFKSDEL